MKKSLKINKQINGRIKNRSSHELGTHEEVKASESVPEKRGVPDDVVMRSERSRVVFSVFSGVGFRHRWHSYGSGKRRRKKVVLEMKKVMD